MATSEWHASRAPGTVPAWGDVAPWHAPEGDALYGIAAIARFLALPFRDVSTMIEEGHLPTTKLPRAHTAGRAALVRYLLDLEHGQNAGRIVGAAPAGVAADALGLLREQHAIGAHLDITVSGVKHHRARNSLPTFKLGKVRFARRASLDAWLAANADQTRSKRRLATIAANRSPTQEAI